MSPGIIVICMTFIAVHALMYDMYLSTPRNRFLAKVYLRLRMKKVMVGAVVLLYMWGIRSHGLMMMCW